MWTNRKLPQTDQTRAHSTPTCPLKTHKVSTKYNKVAVMMSHRMIQLTGTAGFKKLSISSDNNSLVGRQADRQEAR